jgi:hypothetical protein
MHERAMAEDKPIAERGGVPAEYMNGVANQPAVEDAADIAAAIDSICQLRWDLVTKDELLQVAHAYYYFSVQFRENLEVACRLHPDDDKLKQLRREECDTDNLSPWPVLSLPGERLDHDEFVKRLIYLYLNDRAEAVDRLGTAYLAAVRNMDAATRAKSIASYEDGGLSRVFQAMLKAPCWQGAGQQAFRFFLEQHIRFDLDTGGHGSLARHIVPDASILPLWWAFEDLLVAAVPALSVPSAE